MKTRMLGFTLFAGLFSAPSMFAAPAPVGPASISASDSTALNAPKTDTERRKKRKHKARKASTNKSHHRLNA